MVKNTNPSYSVEETKLLNEAQKCTFVINVLCMKKVVPFISKTRVIAGYGSDKTMNVRMTKLPALIH